jgi:PTH1 family peptidyl-tRNA hydrolase
MNETSRPGLVIPSLIVGLGNPGSKYDQTRHNIGFVAVDTLARRWQIPLLVNKRFQADFGEGRGAAGTRVQLLKPLTYMNQSGQAVRAALDWFKLPPQSVLVIYDDMALPMGKLRLRLSGSAGGHNGIRSIISHLGTQEFPRLRIGIGDPQTLDQNSQKDGISHVLGRFSRQEGQLLPDVLQLMVEAVELSLTQGVEKSMSLYNSRAITGSVRS